MAEQSAHVDPSTGLQQPMVVVKELSHGVAAAWASADSVENFGRHNAANERSRIDEARQRKDADEVQDEGGAGHELLQDASRVQLQMWRACSC
jgi:hypothetical protein